MDDCVAFGRLGLSLCVDATIAVKETTFRDGWYIARCFAPTPTWGSDELLALLCTNTK